MIMRGCDIPEALHYDVDHDVWARYEPSGEVTLGMTDPAQTRCGKVVSIRFKKVGRHVARGQSLVTIESAKWVGPFPAVLSGEVVATNEAAFRADILAANKDPYGAGWLVKIEEFEFPDELFYEPKEHMWLRPQADDVAGVRLILDFGFWILDFWRW